MSTLMSPHEDFKCGLRRGSSWPSSLLPLALMSRDRAVDAAFTALEVRLAAEEGTARKEI